MQNKFISHRCFTRLAGGLALAFLCSCLPVGAGAAERDLRAAICPVMVEHFYASPSGDAYVATLSARQAGDYSGSITLFALTEAYEATFDRVHINGTAPLSIRLRVAAQVDYVAMDTAGKVGSEPVSCPTFVIARSKDVDAPAPMPPGAETLATSREKLPRLACGTVFREAEEIKTSLPGTYAGSRNATGDLSILVDSNGNVIAVQIIKSSGDSTVDAVLTTDARGLKFHPAQFLCTPVISEFFYHFSYELVR